VKCLTSQLPLNNIISTEGGNESDPFALFFTQHLPDSQSYFAEIKYICSVFHCRGPYCTTSVKGDSEFNWMVEDPVIYVNAECLCLEILYSVEDGPISSQNKNVK